MSTTRDWAAIARVQGIEATGRELDRLVDGLRAVEEAFRPLAAELPPSQMPAVSFRTVPEGDS